MTDQSFKKPEYLEKITNTTVRTEIEALYKLTHKLYHFGLSSEELRKQKYRHCVTHLARLLDNEIKYFTQKCAGNNFSKEELETFKIRFIARLHSEDESMQGHWTYFSIIHDLATAVYRLCKKYATKEQGPFRLFSETASQKQISELEKQVQKINNKPDSLGS